MSRRAGNSLRLLAQLGRGLSECPLLTLGRRHPRPVGGYEDENPREALYFTNEISDISGPPLYHPPAVRHCRFGVSAAEQGDHVVVAEQRRIRRRHGRPSALWIGALMP